MRRVAAAGLACGAVLGISVFGMAGPAGAQADTIAVTPATDLVDGQVVDVVAATTGGDYGTLALCPVAVAPEVGDPTLSLFEVRDACTGLLCIHDGDTDTGVVDSVAAFCPLAVQAPPIAAVSTSVALPRFTSDGTDCAAVPCVVVFNTWSTSDAQGAVSAAVVFADPAEPSGVETTSTTIELSAPSTVSTVAPTTASTPPAQVLGVQEDNELAVTGTDVGVLAGVGVGLVLLGGGAVARSSRAGISRRRSGRGSAP